MVWNVVFFLTFSHPSIFSLFLSLLLGLESTLIREPRESAWLPVATAKDEKTGRGCKLCRQRGGWGCQTSTLLITHFEREWQTASQTSENTSATCDGVEHFFRKGRIDGVSVASDRRHSSTHAEVISGALVKRRERIQLVATQSIHVPN